MPLCLHNWIFKGYTQIGHAQQRRIFQKFYVIKQAYMSINQLNPFVGEISFFNSQYYSVKSCCIYLKVE